MIIRYILLYLICCFFSSAYAQKERTFGNIPLDYVPVSKITLPDTTLSIKNVYWFYNSDKYIYINYGDYKKINRILIVDTKTWQPQEDFKIDKGYELHGITNNFYTLVLQKFNYFVLFSTVRIKTLEIETEESKKLPKKKYKKYIKQKGGLEPFKSFRLSNGYILSPDKNYFIPQYVFPFFQNTDDFRQEPYELYIFQYYYDKVKSTKVD